MKIKLSELRTLIRESVRAMLNEDDVASWDAQTFWDRVAPTEDEKNSMTNALLGTDGKRWKEIKDHYEILDAISDLENQIALKNELPPPSGLNPRMEEMWKKLQKQVVDDLKNQKKQKMNELQDLPPEEFKVFLGQLGADADNLEIVLSNKIQRQNLDRFLKNQRKIQTQEKMSSMNESKKLKK
jgi:hypothetical protein